MKSKRSQYEGSAVFLAVVMVLLLGCSTGPETIDRSARYRYVPRPDGKVIFEIGKEDRSWSELRGTGFKDKSEYICQIGVDCSEETFPNGVYLEYAYAGYGRAGYEDNQVKRIVFLFTLGRKHRHVVLRIARVGVETTAVSINGAESILVTSEMLGSGDDTRFGAYNLYIGEMKKGEHEIVLTVADDGKGMGSHGLDAISLIAAKRNISTDDN
jgi:hypothetical protein